MLWWLWFKWYGGGSVTPPVTPTFSHPDSPPMYYSSVAGRKLAGRVGGLIRNGRKIR